MLVGLPASGKSTIAHDLMVGRDDVEYISSDELRQELLGDVNSQVDNGLIFETMRKRTVEALQNSRHVIYDATNINRKKRHNFLKQLPKTLDNIEKIVIYVATPIQETLRRNASRDRVVPEEVITQKMYKSLQIPVYSEGWDKIIFEYDEDTLEHDYPKQFTDAIRAEVLFNRDGYGLMQFLAQYFNDEFFGVYDLPHDSKWHNFSVSRHIYYTYRYILENYNGNDKEELLWAGLCHDIGKAFCKTFISQKGEPMKYAQYIGHDCVGSQMVVTFLKKINFSDEFIHNVATLVQYHMFLYDTKVSQDKLKERVGEDLLNKILFLREVDVAGH